MDNIITLIGALLGAGVAVYVAKLQNKQQLKQLQDEHKLQREFFEKQEENERERIFLQYTIERAERSYEILSDLRTAKNLFADSIFELVKMLPKEIESDEDIHNTTAKKQIIRNLNLVLYKEDKQVAKMTQINHYEKSSQTFFYGENGAYSFLIDSFEIKRYDLFFVIYQKEVDGDFDEVRISYYDSKDEYHEFKIFEISEPWIVSKNKIDNDWRSIN